MASLESHGRGGAGNMVNASASPRINASDLETPTLKKPVVTTGRGGTGNMAPNKDAAETRLRQDVAPVLRRESSTQNAGRGGAGNIRALEEAERDEKAVDDGESVGSDSKEGQEGFAATARNWLFGKKTPTPK